jgi:TIR domain/GUN4-like
MNGTSDALFISYASPDREYVRRLEAALTAAGLPVWFDRRMPWGSRWVGELRHMLVSALAVVVVMSRASAASEWVEREILEALSHERELFPILLDGERLFLLASRQHFDARGGVLPGAPELDLLRASCRPGEPGPAERPRFGPTPTPTVAPDVPVPVLRRSAPAPLATLHRLLAEGEWEHADIWTTSMLLEAAERHAHGFMRPRDALVIPPSLLHDLDGAWAGASGHRFGFSRQLQLCERSARAPLTESRRGFEAISRVLGWAFEPGRPAPRYRQLMATAERGDGFFPTLRHPQDEIVHSWYDHWSTTALAVLMRAREAQSPWA